MAMHGYVQLCIAMYGYAWLCRDIHISVWQCRPMYSCVGLCDQIHGSLVDILFYFTLFYFSSQICWKLWKQREWCSNLCVTHANMQLCHLGPFQGIIAKV